MTEVSLTVPVTVIAAVTTATAAVPIVFAAVTNYKVRGYR